MTNNDPAQIVAALRAFAMYAICAVLAIILGVLMTNPMTYSSLGFVAILCTLIFLPILLRWHYPLMILSWSTPIYVFFIKGSPQLFLVMVAISLVISIIDQALNQRRFIKVPMIAWPLLCLIAVVLFTAKMTGGIGLHAFGSDVMGGKKYIFLIVGIIGYFAITAHPIPPEKARRYVTFYFAGATLCFIGDFASVAPGFLHPIFWFLPPSADTSNFEIGTTRLVGTAWAAVFLVWTLMARYGMRGILMSGSLWRPVVFFIAIILIFFGGFRSALVGVVLTILLQFYLEGLHRTRAMPFFVICTLAVAGLCIPLASRLPFTFQRTLAFVPESLVHLSVDARLAAQGSTDWRIQMWQAVLPQIPKYLIVGKGYALTSEDMEAISLSNSPFHTADAANQGLAVSGDYHNGPLSVIIPFGIWGAIVFLWFTVASLRAVYLNYRYSSPQLKLINTFLFTSYVVNTFNFYFVSGGLASGIAGFMGLLGLSIAVNHGVNRAPRTKSINIPFGGFTESSPIRPAFPQGFRDARDLP